MNSNFTPRLMMGAAIVGIVGAAGMCIYEQMNAEKRRAMLLDEVARLDMLVTDMKAELDAFRKSQKEKLVRRAKPKPRVKCGVVFAGDPTDSEYGDCYSVTGTDYDFDSEEFYDIATDDDDALNRHVKIGNIPAPRPKKRLVKSPPLKKPRNGST